MFDDHITGIGTLIRVDFTGEKEEINLVHLASKKVVDRHLISATLVVRREFHEYDGKPRCGTMEYIPGLGNLVEEEYDFNMDDYTGKTVRIFEERLPLESASYMKPAPPPEAVQAFISMSHGEEPEERERECKYQLGKVEVYEYSYKTEEPPPTGWIINQNGDAHPAGSIEDIRVKGDPISLIRACPDCKGTGKYQGFNIIESCKSCRGVGKIEGVSFHEDPRTP